MMPLWFYDPHESMPYARPVDIILLPFAIVACGFGFYFLFMFAFSLGLWAR